MMTKYIECTTSELKLFGHYFVQTSILKGEGVQYHPVIYITDAGPLKLSISGNSDYYVDFTQTFLKLRVKVIKQDGSDNTGPVNLFLHSLFSQIDIYLNEKLITPSDDFYPYRAYLETRLSFGDDAKTSKLTASVFHKDTSGKMDSLDGMRDCGHADGNSGGMKMS